MPAKSLVFRFGDVEVHEGEFALVRHGEKLAIEPKAFRVLLILLQNSPRLVSKQELMDTVWADVEVTEHSLTRAVALLRRALEDDARNPKYIETVATLGYRFLAAVEIVENGALASNSPQSPLLQIDVPATASAPPSRSVARRTTHRIWLVAALGTAIALALAAWQWFLSQAQPKVTNVRQITNDGVPKGRFVTDGSRLYYSARVGNDLGMFQISSQGGEPVEMKELAGMEPLDISADHSQLVLSRRKDGTIWMASVVGGSPRLIAKCTTGDAILSPSGAQMACVVVHTDEELKIAEIDGTQTRTVASLSGIIYRPRWHPNGRKLLVSLWTEDGEFLYEVSADGGGAKKLFPQWKGHSLWRGTWTPDGRYIVFGANDHAAPYRWDIWAGQAEKRPFELWPRSPVQLTAGPLRTDNPEVSPDGKHVFFIGILDRVELVRYDPGSERWVPFLPGLSAEQLDYSPDGTSIAYITHPEGSLFRSNLDGTGKLQLLPSAFAGGNPRWSPDGKQIAVAASRSGESTRVYVASADGSEFRKLSNGECGHDGERDPVWSPDGASIVFSCIPLPRSGLDRDHVVLRIVDLKTGAISVLPNSQGLWSPRWSWKRDFLVALSSESPLKLMLYELKTHTQRELYAPKGGGGWNALSRDGLYAFMWASDGSRITMDRVRISDGAVEHAADLSVLHDSSWAGIAPDGSIIATRNTGNWEIYALDWDAP